MSTERDEYCTDFLDHLNEFNDCHAQILSSKNFKESVLQVMVDKEEEIKHYINNITCDTSFQSPIAKNVQKKDAKLYYRDDLLQAFFQKWLKFSKDVLSNQHSTILKTEIPTNRLAR